MNKYRYDLDGLRGIAIAFVVIFHVFVGKVSGGVDVFLLLSGYFFLGSQLRYAAKPQASANMLWPLWRTVRRLVPALVLVLVTTAVAVDLFAPQLKVNNLGPQLVASLGYYQNWQLAVDGQAYGAAADSVSPLQHLWSMSVQGQFYAMAIVFAALVTLVVRRLRSRGRTVRTIKHLAGIPLLIATAISFGYAAYLQGVAQDLNYYSTWSRLWELTLGGALAVYATTARTPAPVRVAAGYVGLGMVLSTGFLFDGALQFPGPAALYPLGGAALMILGGGAGMGWLGSKPMRWLGNIAYPLYLWHWPLLIVTLVAIGQPEPTVTIGLLVVAASVALAWLSHTIIEQPLRQHAPRPQRGEQRVAAAAASVRTTGLGKMRAASGVLVAALAASVLWVPAAWQAEAEQFANIRLDPRVYPGAMATAGARVPNVPAEPDPSLLVSSLSPAWSDGCMAEVGDPPTRIAIDDFPSEHCTYGDPNAEFTVYVLGGSHAEQWMAALDGLGKAHAFKVIPLVRQGCPAYAEELDGVFTQSCTTFNELVLERVAQDKPDLVISNSTRPLPERLRFQDEVPLSYRTLWNFLEEQGIAFVGLRDNPWFIEEGGAGKLVSICAEETGDPIACGQPRAEVYSAVDPAAALLNSETMKSVDTSAWFCPGSDCPAVIGNIYVYRDGNHISDDYARSTMPLLWAEMEPVFRAAGLVGV
ncbi:acyltransferase [Corynebacterium sp. 35RC1]|nr:acyltransferase [Corynebacterium sp. 35RC1]